MLEVFQKLGKLQLPNSLNKIYDLSRKNKIEDMQNELLELIDTCNIQNGLPNAFLRKVRTAPELSTFLANDQQLQDIEKFCKKKIEWCCPRN